jgi:hypothetical protein
VGKCSAVHGALGAELVLAAPAPAAAVVCTFPEEPVAEIATAVEDARKISHPTAVRSSFPAAESAVERVAPVGYRPRCVQMGGLAGAAADPWEIEPCRLETDVPDIVVVDEMREATADELPTEFQTLIAVAVHYMVLLVAGARNQVDCAADLEKRGT